MISSDRRETLTPSMLLEIVADHFVVSSDDIISARRDKEIVIPRQVVMYLCRNELNMKQEAIGRLLDKDHSTIIYGLKKIDQLLKTDESLRTTVEVLKKKCSSYNT